MIVSLCNSCRNSTKLSQPSSRPDTGMVLSSRSRTIQVLLTLTPTDARRALIEHIHQFTWRWAAGPLVLRTDVSARCGGALRSASLTTHHIVFPVIGHGRSGLQPARGHTQKLYLEPRPLVPATSGAMTVFVYALHSTRMRAHGGVRLYVLALPRTPVK